MYWWIHFRNRKSGSAAKRNQPKSTSSVIGGGTLGGTPRHGVRHGLAVERHRRFDVDHVVVLECQALCDGDAAITPLEGDFARAARRLVGRDHVERAVDALFKLGIVQIEP